MTFTLTLHGTRGSHTVAGPDYDRFGGDTTCIGLKIGQRHLVFDAGSGIVKLGKASIREHLSKADPQAQGALIHHLFLTHTHYDHICGLPYFSPLYMPNATTHFYGPRNPIMRFQETIERFLHPPYHPIPMYEMQGLTRWQEVSESIHFYFLKDQEVPVAVNVAHAAHRDQIPPDDQVEAVVSCMRGYNHPKCGVILYRIQSQGRTVVIATDTEAYVHGDRRLIEFARGADVLIHDGMYTEETYTSLPVPTQGWGHSTINEAISVAQRADVGRLYLVHHAPTYNDEALARIEEQAQAQFSRAFCGFDGLSLDMLTTFPTQD